MLFFNLLNYFNKNIYICKIYFLVKFNINLYINTAPYMQSL